MRAMPLVRKGLCKQLRQRLSAELRCDIERPLDSTAAVRRVRHTWKEREVVRVVLVRQC